MQKNNRWRNESFGISFFWSNTFCIIYKIVIWFSASRVNIVFLNIPLTQKPCITKISTGRSTETDISLFFRPEAVSKLKYMKQWLHGQFIGNWVSQSTSNLRTLLKIWVSVSVSRRSSQNFDPDTWTGCLAVPSPAILHCSSHRSWTGWADTGNFGLKYNIFCY